MNFEARLDGRLLCTSTTPLLSSARVLLKEGHSPETVLEMVRSGSPSVDMKGRLGDLAKLTVRENVHQGPIFARHTSMPETVKRRATVHPLHGQEAFQTEGASA